MIVNVDVTYHELILLIEAVKYRFDKTKSEDEKILLCYLGIHLCKFIDFNKLEDDVMESDFEESNKRLEDARKLIDPTNSQTIH